jgi:hypothetical protein
MMKRKIGCGGDLVAAKGSQAIKLTSVSPAQRLIIPAHTGLATPLLFALGDQGIAGKGRCERPCVRSLRTWLGPLSGIPDYIRG